MKTHTMRWAALIAGAVAVTATATALVTASLLAGDQPLTVTQVDQQLGQAPTGSATPGEPTPATSGTAATAAGDLVYATTPGTVVARCEGSLATLVSWSPNPGFRADDPVRGPAAAASIRFESDVADDYLVTITCDQGQPVGQLSADPDDHGGRDKRGRGGSGSG